MQDNENYESNVLRTVYAKMHNRERREMNCLAYMTMNKTWATRTHSRSKLLVKQEKWNIFFSSFKSRICKLF